MQNSPIYSELAVAYARGYAVRTNRHDIPEDLLTRPLDDLSQEERERVLVKGKEWGLDFFRFKRSHETFPRIRFALGALRSLRPVSLLDAGPGRGAALFPFVALFPDMPISCVEILDKRIEFIEDVKRGGIDSLNPLRADVCACPIEDGGVDVATALEILEHVPDYRAAVTELVRVAQRAVIVTVPAKPDDNPEHIHLLTPEKLTAAFNAAGGSRLKFGYAGESLTCFATLR